MYTVELESLSKEFQKVAAVDNISLKVKEGEIFGFLGPNGAGKSTTIMILTTLLKPTSGKALVGGFNVVTQAKQVRKTIGYVQQDTAVDEFLTGRENLYLQARLNHLPSNLIDPRINEVLDLIELKDKQHEPVVTYSGGMRKRLDIAGGLLHRPKVLFLDEPTVGLDIQTRRRIWEYIKKIHDEFHITIFLTTHYMEEADNLCDRIAIIDYGKIQVLDSPQSLKDELGNEVVTITAENIQNKDDFITKLNEISFVKNVTTTQEKITVFTTSGTQVIPIIFQTATSLGIKIKSIHLAQPSLDDVFISYTGRELRDDVGKYNRRKEYANLKRMRA